MGPVEGLRVLVTGAGGGMGAAFIEALVTARALPVGSDHPDRCEPIEERGIPAVPMDVADPADVVEAVAAAAEVHGGLDAVLHVAGVTGSVPFLELELEEWRRVMSVNLDGVFHVGSAVARQLVRQGSGGSMTFVTSQLAERPLRGKAHYTTSKAGADGLVRAMALELAEHGIRVNALAPGVTATSMAMDRLGKDPKAMAWTTGHIPLGRLAEPDELVGAALLLVGRSGSYITGTSIVVDGGYLLH